MTFQDHADKGTTVTIAAHTEYDGPSGEWTLVRMEGADEPWSRGPRGSADSADNWAHARRGETIFVTISGFNEDVLQKKNDTERSKLIVKDIKFPLRDPNPKPEPTDSQAGRRGCCLTGCLARCPCPNRVKSLGGRLCKSSHEPITEIARQLENKVNVKIFDTLDGRPWDVPEGVFDVFQASGAQFHEIIKTTRTVRDRDQIFTDSFQIDNQRLRAMEQSDWFETKRDGDGSFDGEGIQMVGQSREDKIAPRKKQLQRLERTNGIVKLARR